MDKIVIYVNNLAKEKDFLQNYLQKNFKQIKDVNFVNNNRPKKYKEKNIIYLKSMYDINYRNKNYKDMSWTYPGTLIGLQPTPLRKKKNVSCQIYTAGRSGTIFLEELLNLLYDKVLHHFSIYPGSDFTSHSEDNFFTYKFDKNSDLYILYRNDLMSFISSQAIAWSAGFHHENKFDYTNIVIKRKEYKKIVFRLCKYLNLFFNSVCNLIVAHPETYINIVSFNEIIPKFKNRVNHKPINYGKGKSKRDLFEDWESFEKIANNAIPLLEQSMQNWLDKLNQLGIRKGKFDIF